MTSKVWFNELKNQLVMKKFHVINDSYTDGYFVFDMGDDSVVQFSIKELKGWLFGIWFEFDETDKTKAINATFFTRHKDYLDKFKPSRSYFRKDIKITDELDEFDVLYVLELCDQLKHHPILSYCMDEQNSYMGGYGFVRGNLFCSYAKNRLYYLKKHIKDYYNNNSKINLTILRLNKIKKALEKESEYIKEVSIKDSNKDGWICSPRYNIDITWNSTYNEDITNIGLFVTPFYKWNGKPRFNSNKVFVEWSYIDDDRHFAFTPDDEELGYTYGWRYKLYSKLFKRTPQKV